MQRNPYSTGHVWDDETRAAYAAMPLYGNHVVALDYVHDRDVAAQEAAWREFCRSQPRHLWPTWLEGWAQRKRLRGLS